MNGRELEEYLSRGVEKIVQDVLKASFHNPGASLFMAQHLMDSRQAGKKRQEAEKKNSHIPPFLIASITNLCNLHCKGCYARATKGCEDHACQSGLLTGDEWSDIFGQAEELGIEFILLAGGEPFMRKDVLTVAGNHRKILFPVFTNGTMIREESLELLEKNRNLLPVLSIEGDRQTTDERRGAGVYDQIADTMKMLKKKGILFGASVTVSKENLDEVLSEKFLTGLYEAGTKAVVFVEYVPMDTASRDSALGDAEREKMRERLQNLRQSDFPMLLISFPGDEKTSGGCLAAGRGFFHINATGGAEPCPFSPYSDTNVRNTSLLEALRSPLFLRLQESGSLTQEHIGGCTLFEQRKQVEELLSEVSA